MSKQKIILITVIILLVIGVGGFWGWRKINSQKAINNNQWTITKTQKAIDNEQQSTDNSQETIDNNQNTIDNKQQTTDNKPQAVTSNQEPVTGGNNQKAIDNSQNTIVKTQQVTENNSTSSTKIVQKLVAWGFQKSSGRKIDTIILHSSYDALGNDPFSVSGVIAEYKQAQVSPHYLIARDGTIYQLVSDQNIAWHAGVAKMPDGRTDVNSFSIGIEIINTQDGKFTDQQYSAVNRLIGDLKNKYPIKNILGHSDIAPGRKTDPWGIAWKKVNR